MKKFALLLLLPLVFQPGRTQLLFADAHQTLGRRIAIRASAYMGTRYKFGGRTKRGLDCSGLIARVWKDLKLGKIPHQASVLYKLGRPVEPEEVQAGDLVFFENTYRRGISHVGIYTGNAKFIHASGRHRGVTISRITEPYYLDRIVGARRLY